MKISVVVPTFYRQESLAQCMKGLMAQVRPADQIIVVTQSEDSGTLTLLHALEAAHCLQIVFATGKGQVLQLNQGLSAATGDVIAITDDDAVPRPDWLSNIEAHFAHHPDLGGVGGRDIVHEEGTILSGDAHVVGKVQWFGRVVGNHHIYAEACAEVDILKGANMSYRAAAVQGLRFDTTLRGNGAQVCNDMAFSLAVQKRGWRLLFDPAVAVDHYPAARPLEDQRKRPSLQSVENQAFNSFLALRRHMRSGWCRQSALFWAWAVGTQNIPGGLRTLRARLQGRAEDLEVRAVVKRAWFEAKRIGKEAT